MSRCGPLRRKKQIVEGDTSEAHDFHLSLQRPDQRRRRRSGAENRRCAASSVIAERPDGRQLSQNQVTTGQRLLTKQPVEHLGQLSLRIAFRSPCQSSLPRSRRIPACLLKRSKVRSASSTTARLVFRPVARSVTRSVYRQSRCSSAWMCISIIMLIQGENRHPPRPRFSSLCCDVVRSARTGRARSQEPLAKRHILVSSPPA
jgi:hypothetical protein